jgi:hypothetical protein
MRSAQENLRLSAGTLSKLQGEFRNVCGENDVLQKKVSEYDVALKKLTAES